MNDRYSRQSFLGPNAEAILQRLIVGVVGLGGGGSHIVQQLAHIGVTRFVLYDADTVEESNLNRMVGATADDAATGSTKISVASRVVRALLPTAEIIACGQRWQDDPDQHLRGCDVIFGCVDGLDERLQLEAMARRYLVPYVDVGLDVHVHAGEAPRMAGQCILSLPTGPCFRCLGAITDQSLAVEAARYGDAGPRPQVVWANGVLASVAVGLAIDLLTGWTNTERRGAYLVYDGNTGVVYTHPRWSHVPPDCGHFPVSQVGPVAW